MADAFTGVIACDGVINLVEGVTIVVVANPVVIDGATNPIVVVAIVVVTKPIVVVTGINSVVVDGVKPFVGSAVGPEIGKNN